MLNDILTVIEFILLLVIFIGIGTGILYNPMNWLFK